MSADRRVGLKETLAALSRRSSITVPAAPFLPRSVQRAHKEVSKRLGEIEPKMPHPISLQSTYEAVKMGWTQERSLAGLSRRDLRRAVWVMFDYPAGVSPQEWLGADEGLAEAYLRWCEGAHRASAVRVLVRALLIHYPGDLPTFHLWRERLRLLVLELDSLRLRKWKEPVRERGILDKDGVDRFARRWLRSANPSRHPEGEGLGSGVEVGEFVRSGLAAIGQGLSSRISRGSNLSLKLDFFLNSERRLRFPDDGGRIANWLLEPFYSRRPRPEVEQKLVSFFVRHLGHPEMQRHRWTGASEKSRHVMLRWLIRDTIEDFFRLLDETADKAHWEDRKAFWGAYLGAELIEDAWIALGPEAASLAQRASRPDLHERYARLRAKGHIKPNHSVLLMRIGDVIVVDWSHAGACRIWHEDNPEAPKMYQPKYGWDDFRRGEPWWRPHQGNWQDNVARHITEETGIPDPRGRRRTR